MRRPLLACVTGLIALVAMVLAITPPVASGVGGAAVTDTPWGPVHVLHSGPVSTSVTQATSRLGLTVVAFTENPHSANPQVDVRVQVPGHAWSTAIPLSSSEVVRPTAIAWKNTVSVIWQSPAGADNWLFHLRTVRPDGTLGLTRRLTTATSAYPGFQAAMNGKGELALAWVNRDNTDRVTIHHADRTWTSTAPVPVIHPTAGGKLLVANPLQLFLAQSGQVTEVTWGTLGSSARAIWKMRYGLDGAWHHQRIGPIDGQAMGYQWVGQANFAADPAGDVAAVWSQQDPSTRQWTTMFRYWPSTGPASPVKVLSHLRCDSRSASCADVGMSLYGATLVAYGVHAGSADAAVRFLRGRPDGEFTTPETISAPLWMARYRGVRLSSDANGHGLVSFLGNDHQHSYTGFVRCPKYRACDQPLMRYHDPGWLDSWVTSIGPLGAGTVTWTFHHSPESLSSRHLDPFIGAP